MLDAMRRLWHHPLPVTRLQAWLGLLAILAVLYLLFGVRVVLVFVGVFVVVGVIPYLWQRYRAR
jgi:hypothetical protein